MARCVITIHDKDDGSAGAEVMFDPPLQDGGDPDAVLTRAQAVGFGVMQFLARGAERAPARDLPAGWSADAEASE